MMTQQLQAPGMNRAQRRQMQRTQGKAHKRAGQVHPIVDTVGTARDRAAKLTDAERGNVMTPARMGFKALREGVATHEEWAAVSSAITVAMAIDEQGIVRGLREHLLLAEHAINAVWQRVESEPGAPSWGRKTTLYFDEIAAIQEALHLHDFQLQQLAFSEFRKAVDVAKRNVRAAGGREIHRKELPPQLQGSLV